MGKKATCTCLLLTQKGEVKETKIPLDETGRLTEPTIQKTLKQKGQTSEVEVLGTYPFKGGAAELILFGYLEGNVENQHELPPPNDGVTVYGDILVVQAKDAEDWANPLPLKVADYEAFYAKAFGGGEEEDEGEEEAVEEEAVEEEAVEDEELEEGEEEEEEEDAGGEEEDEDAGGEEVGDEEAPVRAPKRAKAKKAAAAPRRPRKTTAAATALAAAASLATYTNYLHVNPAAELQQESPQLQQRPEPFPLQRTRVIESLKKLFVEQLGEEEIVALERAIYNGALEVASEKHIGKAWAHPPFVELYRMHAKHIAANFHPDSYVGNKELFQKYRDGQATIDELAWMDTYQLFEARWRDSFVQQQAREKRQLEGNKAMATDRFLCTRCWKRECTYYEMQTRSADEPMTIFITCLNCGKHWRQ
jgi:DNA-directed RNA polymerase subunit M/transcription elongation factor TFIIS